MGYYQPTQKLPVINLSGESLKPGSSRWESTTKDVCKALEEYSCFLATFDKVPSCKPFFDSLKGLFDLSRDTKTTHISNVPYFAYIGDLPHSPLFESLGIDDGTSFDQVSSFVAQMWPQGNDEYRDLIHSYSTQVTELDKMITRMLFEFHGVENSCEDHLKSNVYNIRMNKYRANKAEDTKTGLISHTDLGFIGINQQSDVDGLEVKLKDGTWLPVEFPPHAFIVLAGDGMMAWSNGRIRHCVHRVTMTGKERYSTAIFSHHTGFVRVPQAFIDENNPRKFRDFEQLGLVRFRFAYPDIPDEERVTAYCGVNN